MQPDRTIPSRRGGEAGERGDSTRPLAASYQAKLAYIYNLSRRPDDAIEVCNKASRSIPDAAVVHNTLGGAYALKTIFRQALAEAEKGSEGPIPNIGPALIHAPARRLSEARQALATLTSYSRAQYVPKTYFAALSVVIGDFDAAFEFLDKAFEERSEELSWVNVDPTMDPIRNKTRGSTICFGACISNHREGC